MMKNYCNYLFVLICAVVCVNFSSCEGEEQPSTTQEEQNYVNLGLSSGTLWKSVNEPNSLEENGFFNFYAAESKFEKQLPSKEQWMELVNECNWSWTGLGCKVVGPNGNYISIPASGWRDPTHDDALEEVGEHGYYWSSTTSGNDNAFNLSIDNYSDKLNVKIGAAPAIMKCSVRLVKSPAK